LVQGVADYVLNVYFHDDDALLVNLFVASEVVWKRAGGAVAIVQDTDYPAADAVRLTVREPGEWPFRDQAAHPGVGERRDAAGQRQDRERRARRARHREEPLEGGDTIDLVVPQPLRTLSIDTRTRTSRH
jgi:hypothetical protein